MQMHLTTLWKHGQTSSHETRPHRWGNKFTMTSCISYFSHSISKCGYLSGFVLVSIFFVPIPYPLQIIVKTWKWMYFNKIHNFWPNRALTTNHQESLQVLPCQGRWGRFAGLHGVLIYTEALQKPMADMQIY